MIRVLIVLSVTCLGSSIQADAWGECRDQLVADGATLSEHAAVTGITLRSTSGGLQAALTDGQEPVVTIEFENGTRAVLDESNTVAASRWMAAHLMLNHPENQELLFIYQKSDIDLVFPLEDCRRYGIVTTWPESWPNN